jgi:hypothetical protein
MLALRRNRVSPLLFAVLSLSVQGQESGGAQLHKTKEPSMASLELRDLDKEFERTADRIDCMLQIWERVWPKSNRRSAMDARVEEMLRRMKAGHVALDLLSPGGRFMKS